MDARVDSPVSANVVECLLCERSLPGQDSEIGAQFLGVRALGDLLQRRTTEREVARVGERPVRSGLLRDPVVCQDLEDRLLACLGAPRHLALDGEPVLFVQLSKQFVLAGLDLVYTGLGGVDVEPYPVAGHLPVDGSLDLLAPV